MSRSRSLASLAITIGILTIAGGAAADDPKKDELVNDPAVVRSLEPPPTAGGRTPPNMLPAESTPELQQAIDRAHEGSTGTTRDGATRRPDDQAPGLADAPSGAPGQLGPVVPPPQ